MITSAYYLSLDDDSFPAAGDLGSAVQFLEGKPDTLGLAFSIILRDEGTTQLGPNSCSGPLLHRLWSLTQAGAFLAPWWIR